MKYESNLTQALQYMEDSKEEFLSMLGDQVTDKAVEKAPKDSERLANSMAFTVNAKNGEMKSGTTDKGWHGHFSELGTENQPADPWLTPAFIEITKEAEATVQIAFRKKNTYKAGRRR